MSIMVMLNVVSFLVLKIKFEFKLTTLLIFQIFILASLLFIFLNIFDIFYFPRMPPTAESKLNLQIILLSGLALPLMLSKIFNYSAFGELTEQVTSFNIAYGLFTIGITIIEMVTDGSYLINFIIANNEWLIDFSPYYFVILGLYIASSITGIALGIRNIVTHHFMAHTKFPIIFIGLGFILLFTALNVDETITTPVGISIYLSGLFFLFAGITSVFYNILQHPITTIFLRNDTSSLFKRGLVNWVLFGNRENGPTLELQSDNLNDHKDIIPDEIFMFGVQSLMTAYNENKFIQNTSITPFAAKNDYFALTVSFMCKDGTLQDHRFKNRLQTVLIIIIPSSIFFSFIKPVKNLTKINNIIRSKGLEKMHFQDIKNPEFLEKLSENCLNVFI